MADSTRARELGAGTTGAVGLPSPHGAVSTWSAATIQRPVMASDQIRFLARVRAKVMWRVRGRLTTFVASRRHSPVFSALATASKTYLEMWRNVSYDLKSNGELRSLRAIAQSHPTCIFDVGANQGDWSVTAAELFPDAQIHAFEIVPDTAQRMRERFARAQVSSVLVNSFGLSDEPGTVTVAYLPGFPEMSSAAVADSSGSLAAIRSGFGGEQLRECEVRTGDDYCRERGIEHVDFLKIDVEGLEKQVLQGFAGMLESGSIDVIQFEYGHINATIRCLLGDLYDVLDRYDYTVGKLFPDGVEFRAYDAWRDEDFMGPNYLAVYRPRADLIGRLMAAGSDAPRTPSAATPAG